ncbi:hypothetical protein BOX15_Mlig020676g2, partial [Macrostomum lignano]
EQLLHFIKARGASRAMSRPINMPANHQLEVPVYFCRHAESTYNAHGDSSPDVPLSERGRAQAKALSGHYHIVLCSPMQRARQTIELSKITYSKMLVVPELREVVSVSSDHLAHERSWHETGSQAQERCAAVLQLLKSEAAAAAGGSPRILLVSHCVFGGRLYAHCNADSPRCPKLRNAAIVPFPVTTLSGQKSQRNGKMAGL